MADKSIGSLPAAEVLDDGSLLLAEQQGEAVHFRGKQLKDYARQGVDALVQAARESAEKALQAAQDAQEAAGKVQDVTDEAEAAIAAAQAAENARAAAVQAAQYAKNAAALAAENAATEAVRQAETQLQGYVSEAEQAKQDAQNAAGTAAQDAVTAVGSDMAGYVSAAQAAQKAAEQARDEAQGIAGGDYLDRHTYDPTGKKTDVFAYVDQKVANIPTPDVSGQIGSHNTDGAAHADIRALINGLTTRLNALADSDDTTLDQMSELVAYIKSNKSLIDAITTAKVSVSDIVNDLVTNNASKPLSAAQGVALKALVDAAAAAASTAQTTADGKANSSHNQAASTITAGTFAGQVVANSSGQAPGTKLIRNSKLLDANTYDAVTNWSQHLGNGEIAWRYE